MLNTTGPSEAPTVLYHIALPMSPMGQNAPSTRPTACFRFDPNNGPPPQTGRSDMVRSRHGSFTSEPVISPTKRKLPLRRRAVKITGVFTVL